MRFRSVRERLLVAKDSGDVKHLLAEAVSGISRGELASLPYECQAALAEQDTHTAAVELLTCDLKYRGTPGATELLRQIAELYATASVRLTALDHLRPMP